MSDKPQASKYATVWLHYGKYSAEALADADQDELAAILSDGISHVSAHDRYESSAGARKLLRDFNASLRNYRVFRPLPLVSIPRPNLDVKDAIAHGYTHAIVTDSRSYWRPYGLTGEVEIHFVALKHQPAVKKITLQAHSDATLATVAQHLRDLAAYGGESADVRSLAVELTQMLEDAR